MTPATAGNRRVEIDMAKGLPCLLMVAAHFISAKLLPFGTFACSGMTPSSLADS